MLTHPITIDAARLTWDGRTPTGTELRSWLESLPGSEFATGLLILADALDREPTRPEPDDISADLFAEAMQKMKAATDSVARKGVARLPRDWIDVDFETQRDHERRELAERFANQRQTRTGAINELAALLDAEDERDRLAAEAIETALTGGCRECHQVNGHHKLDCGKRS